MRHTRVVSLALLAMSCLSLATTTEGKAADDKDEVLFDFAVGAMAADWVPVKLPEIAADQPAPKVEIVRTPKGKGDAGPAGDSLQITFDGGDWPTVGTSKLP